MTAAHVEGGGARPLPGRFAAMLVYAVRISVPPRRRVLLALPLGASVLFGLLTGVVDDGTSAEALATVAGGGLFSLVVPLTCLVVGDAVLGAEVRAGTFIVTWLSPAPFPAIVVGRWLAGWLVAIATLVPAVAAAALVAGVPGAIGALVVAVVAGSAAYLGLFVLVGAATRRAALWSIGIVLLVEHLLGSALTGIAQLSPQWQIRTAYGELGPDADDLLVSGIPSGWGAVVRLAIVTVVTVALATWRVRHLRVTGSDE